MLGKDGHVVQAVKQWFDALVATVNGSLTPQTYATLVAPSQSGAMVVISDSTTQAWGAVIAGGGAFTVLGWWNGTAWTVIGK